MSEPDPGNMPETAPSMLRDCKSWLMWRYDTVSGETKRRKVPYYIGGTHRRGEHTPAHRALPMTALATAATVYPIATFEAGKGGEGGDFHDHQS